MKLFEQILASFGWTEYSEPTGATAQLVQDYCAFLLPADYSAFLNKQRGFEGSIGPEYVVLWAADEVVSTNTEMEVSAQLPDTLLIGSNGGGEFIALEMTATGQIRVVLSPWADFDAEYHIEIGVSFTDFLARLRAGQEWFED